MGFLRIFLALSVVAGHTQSTVFGFRGIDAYYAVNVFFIISGFYMAMVLCEKYQSLPLMTFYKSRALRLYPVYFVGLIISLIVSWPHFLMVYNRLTNLSQIFMLAQNLVIFGQDFSHVVCSPQLNGDCLNGAEITVNPPSWSLSVELIFYVLAPFFVRSVRKSFILLCTGLIYLLLVKSVPLPVDYVNYFQSANKDSFVYYFYPSSFIFFSAGAIGYHVFYSKVNINYFLALLTIVSLSFIESAMPFWHMMAISAAIPLLFLITKKNKNDRLIGELSFPAYILHFPILRFWDQHRELLEGLNNYISYGTVVAICTLTFGGISYFCFERFVDRYRHNRLENKEDGFLSSLIKWAAVPAIISFPFICVGYIYSGL